MNNVEGTTVDSDAGGITLDGVLAGDPVVLWDENTHAVGFRLMVNFGGRTLIVPMIARSREREVGGYAEAFRKVAQNGDRVRVTGQLEFSSGGLATLEVRAYMIIAKDPQHGLDLATALRATRADFNRIVLYSMVPTSELVRQA